MQPNIAVTLKVGLFYDVYAVGFTPAQIIAGVGNQQPAFTTVLKRCQCFPVIV
jgi:hypothetical protein